MINGSDTVFALPKLTTGAKPTGFYQDVSVGTRREESLAQRQACSPGWLSRGLRQECVCDSGCSKEERGWGHGLALERCHSRSGGPAGLEGMRKGPGGGHTEKEGTCLSEGCDERQKVGEDPGRKEKELTREAMSLATLEGNLEGTAGLSNTGEERCLYGPCLGGKHPWRLSGRWRYRLRSLVEKPSQGQSWDV